MSKTSNLSPAQQDIFFLDRQFEGSAISNIGGYLTLKGSMDIERMRAAYRIMANGSDICRIRIHAEAEVPGMSLVPAADARLDYLDFSRETNPIAAAEEWMQSEFVRPFAIDGALYQAAILKITADSSLYFMKCHHIVIDGWGFTLWCKYLLGLYAALSFKREEELSPINLPSFFAAVEAQDESVEKGEEERIAYWKEEFSDFPEIPFHHAGPRNEAAPSERYIHEIEADCYERMLQVLETENINVLAYMVSCFALYLSRVSGKEDLVLGLPAHNRRKSVQKQTIGLFMSVAPQRFRFGHDITFGTLLLEIGTKLKQNYRNQISGLSKINRAIGTLRHGHEQPFQAIFNYQKLDFEMTFEGEAVVTQYMHHNFEQNPLTVAVCEYSKGCSVQLCIDYNLNFFNAADVEQFAKCFEDLLINGIRMLDVPLSQIDLVGQEDFERLDAFNRRDPALLNYLPQQFDGLANETTEKTALRFQEQTLSYGQLLQQVNRLANLLLQKGVVHGDYVAILLPRSLDVVVAMLAIHRIGAAFIPIDPDFPKERIDYILADSEAKLILTVTGAVTTLDQAVVIALDDAQTQLQLRKLDQHCPVICPSNWSESAAYLIYTSGSTGRPKGAVIPHGALANFLSAMSKQVGYGADDVWVALTTISFDISLLEILGPLHSRATLVMATDEEGKDGRKLIDVLDRHAVSIMQATPSRWQILLAAGWKGNVQLRALCGGEALKAPLLAELLEKCGLVYNCYGPTEATIWTLARRITPEVPIAERLLLDGALANVDHFVLDKNKKLLPFGVIGELYIGGQALATSYWKRDELTAEKFVTVEGIGGKTRRLYATGDLVRMLANNKIEFLGRADHQVKIRGYRIELEEIESVIEKNGGIQKAVVSPWLTPSGETVLIGYLLWKEGKGQDEAALLAHLRNTLPSYMVPQQLRSVAAFALTPNGKIDRKALPRLEVDTPASTVTFTDPIESWLQAVWENALQVTMRDPGDSFFAMGGNSLSVNRMLGEIENEYGVRLPLKVFFQDPVIERIASAIRSGLRDDGKHEAVRLQKLTGSGPFPTSFAQQQMWYLHQVAKGSGNYNMPMALSLTGQVDRAALAQALDVVVARHPILRARYVEQDGQLLQEPVPARFQLVVSDFSSLESAQQADLLKKRVENARRYGFSLEKGENLYAELVLLSGTRSALLITLHHIASDGLSNEIILEELSSTYAALANGSAFQLEEPGPSYFDYAHWQAATYTSAHMAENDRFWKEQLADVPQLHGLPTSYTRPAQFNHLGKVLRREISAPISRQIKLLADEYKVTPYILLQNVFALLIHKLSGELDVTIGSPVANRLLPQVGRSVGLFANTLVLRSRIDTDQDFPQFLSANKNAILAAFDHQDMPFERLVKLMGHQYNPSHTPLFQIMFSYQEQGSGRLELEGLQVEPIVCVDSTAKFDLTLVMEQTAEGMQAEWEYATAIFDDELVSMYARSFEHLLASVCEAPRSKLSSLHYLSPEDRQAALRHARASTVRTLSPAFLHQDIERWAECQPDANALIAAGRSCTYRELNQGANRLAHLMRAEGLPRNAIVAVIVEDAFDEVMAMLAVLKAGCAYLPVDARYLASRGLQILQDARASLVITCRRHQQEHRLDGALVLDDEATRERLSAQPAADLPAELVGLDRLDTAYVIYTSGSTGKPKGVAISHRSIATHIREMTAFYGVESRDVCLQFASWTVDTALEQLFCSLTSGASIFLREDALWNPGEFFAVLEKYGITSLDLPPAFLKSLVTQMRDEGGNWPATGLRTLILGGEALGGDLLDYWRSSMPPGISLINAYGPTEATITAAAHRFDRAGDDGIKVGKPVAGKAVYILDGAQNLQATGIHGELYIGGEGLSSGYLNREELNRSVFLEHPEFGRLYRTGDLGRFDAEGDITLIGRTDYQTKIRGYRIELEEVESHLNALLQVDQVAVVARKNQLNELGLVAFVVHAEHLSNGALQNLKRSLKEHLPPHYVPEKIVQLESLPLTANDKIDRKKLAELPLAEPRQATEAPATATEKTVAEIWRGLLKLDAIDRHANFFDLGGHSLLASRMLSSIKNIFPGIDPQLAAIFTATSLAEVAEYVDQLLLKKSITQSKHPRSNHEVESFEL